MANTRTFPAWSHSRLVVGETCHFRAFLQFKKKIPEPDRPELPEGQEYPNDRGTRIHDQSEQFVKGERDELPPESAKFFKPEFEKLRALYKRGKVITEQMWTYDDGWVPLEDLGEFPKGKWPAEFVEKFYKIWCRIKTDATVFLSKKEIVVIDYKSGKRYGNEVKHMEQLQLYAFGAALRYPDAEKFTCELWYVDLNEIVQVTFTRKQAYAFSRNWTKRGLSFTDMVDFQPNPTVKNCMFCPYKTGSIGKPERNMFGTGHCTKNPDKNI